MSGKPGRPRLFGTDGIRAPFGEPPLVEPAVTALAAALAATLRERGSARPLVLVGGDTRASTPEICRWLAAGLAAGGADPRYAGVVPTPGVAFLTRLHGAAAGISVSASHNPFPDNGIKLIDGAGRKWSEADELALEDRLIGAPVEAAPGAAPRPPSKATTFALVADPRLRGEYLQGLAATLDGAAAGGRPLAGLRLALDAGNGAASSYAAPLFEGLGAEVVLLHAKPDGRNVNAGCGSTAPAEMAARTAAESCDLGAAFDGDADRCILADERGTVRDGDAMLYLWATHLYRQGLLTPAKIVATSMSNLGLTRALAREGIGVVRCDVGDRYVVEAMQREGILLGGEQSGHLVHLGLATTGDGLLTALQMAALRRAADRTLSELLAGFRRYPQILRNVPVERKTDFAAVPKVTAAARAVEEKLGDDGRLVLRYSGTEPLARIMIEGPDQPTIEALAEELAAVIAGELGGRPAAG